MFPQGSNVFRDRILNSKLFKIPTIIIKTQFNFFQGIQTLNKLPPPHKRILTENQILIKNIIYQKLFRFFFFSY